MKIINWNIQGGRKGGVDLDRIAADLRAFSDFDVLCLQEVAAGDAELLGRHNEQFQGLADRFPGHEAFSQVVTDMPTSATKRLRLGNMVLSRLPVLQVFRHSLPWPAEPGMMGMQRGALEATVRTPRGELRVTAAHLEYFSATQRAAQVDRLRALHAEASLHARTERPGDASHGAFARVARGTPSVLTGDFNFLPDSPDHQRMLMPIDGATAAYRDAWTIVHAEQPHAPTVCLHDRKRNPDADPPFTFDFMFVSEDLAPRVRGLRVDTKSEASAHQPVLLELD